jgi:hypothetical protein
MGQFLGAGGTPSYIGPTGTPQSGGGMPGGGMSGGRAPQQYGNQIFNTNQPPGGYLRGGSPRPPQLPRYGGFGQASQFGAQNPFFSRPGQFNAGLMGSLMGQPSLLSRMNQVSGFGGQGGPFGMGGRYGSFGGGGSNPYGGGYGGGTMGGFGGFLNQLMANLGRGGGASVDSQFSGIPNLGLTNSNMFNSGGGGMNSLMGGPSGGYDGAGNFLG